MTATKASTETPSSETATNAPTATSDFPPTHSTATAATNGETMVQYRVITTKFGPKAVLVTGDGTEYWGSPFITRQLAEGKVQLPAKVVSFTSAKYGRTGYKLIPV